MLSFRSTCTVLALAAAALPAAAQTIQPSPGVQTFQGFAQPQQQQQQQQEPPCFKDFVKLRTDTETKAKALKAAGDRHAPPAEACKLFNVFLAAEAKMIKYVEENGTWCGIPPQVLQQMKGGHSKAGAVRTKVCEAAARGPVLRAPTLSDALGTNLTPNANNVKTGRGTYDTLTGSPLAR
jgi:hypothetical protein